MSVQESPTALILAHAAAAHGNADGEGFAEAIILSTEEDGFYQLQSDLIDVGRLFVTIRATNFDSERDRSTRLGCTILPRERGQIYCGPPYWGS